MEQNTPIIAKKIWNLMRVAFFMLRKGICKRKILLDLNLVMKRGKLVGKSLQKTLMFHLHHHHNHQKSSSSSSKPSKDIQCFSSPPPGEYEFSCSSTPSYHHFFSNKKKHQTNNNNNNNSSFFTPYSSFEDLDNNIEIVVHNMIDMMEISGNDSVQASPAVLGLGLGRNPGVRQLRITDSPFPIQDNEDGNKHVDAKAEDFINKFYSQLKNQKYY